MKKLFAILACVFVMSGCAASGDKSGKVLKMGTNAAFEPFEFVADNDAGIVGKFDGVDVALAKIIAEENGYTLEILDMDFESLGAALESGRVDFVAAGMTVTEDREKTFDFSSKYYKATQYIVILEESKDDIKSAADLVGKNVGVQMATTGDILCSEMDGINVQSFKRGADAILALSNKQVDAVVIDSEPAKNFNKVTPGLLLLQDSEAFDTEEYAMAVKKGNKTILDMINKTLDKQISSGKVTELVIKYTD